MFWVDFGDFFESLIEVNISSTHMDSDGYGSYLASSLDFYVLTMHSYLQINPFTLFFEENFYLAINIE